MYLIMCVCVFVLACYSMCVLCECVSILWSYLGEDEVSVSACAHVHLPGCVCTFMNICEYVCAGLAEGCPAV